MGMLPTALAEITPEWLTGALSQRAPGVEVRAVEVQDVIWGTATKAFLRVEYAGQVDEGPPEALCIKGGFNDEMRAVAGLGYRVEALFYRDIAPSFGDSVPRCWYAQEDAGGNQGLVIIDDLRASDARFRRPQDRYEVGGRTLDGRGGTSGRPPQDCCPSSLGGSCWCSAALVLRLGSAWAA